MLVRTRETTRYEYAAALLGMNRRGKGNLGRKREKQQPGYIARIQVPESTFDLPLKDVD